VRSAKPSDKAIRALRARARLVAFEAVLLLAIVAIGAIFFARAPGDDKTALDGILFASLAVGLLVEFAIGVYLLHAPCPHCGSRFSERSLINLFVAPPPAIFASRCAQCGVSMRIGAI
jgi:hypothetical protein